MGTHETQNIAKAIPDARLTIAWILAKLFKQRPHGVEFRTKPGPIPSFQPLNSAVIVAEGLVCSKVHRTRETADAVGGVESSGNRRQIP